MYVTQKELFKNLEHDFIKQLMHVAENESRQKDEMVFREGEPATHIYFLIKGKVKLTIGEIEHPVYTAIHPGEIFGWSSVVGREAYSASARCLGPTLLRKIDKELLFDLLAKNEHNGMLFYRKLTETLGNRLLYSYSLATQYIYPPSQPTEQLAEPTDMV